MNDANRKAMFAKKKLKQQYPKGKYPLHDTVVDVHNNSGKYTLKELYKKHPRWTVDHLFFDNYIIENNKNKMMWNGN